MFYSLFPNFKLKNLFSKMDVLSLVLKALNFEDEISIRRGKCNTPIKKKKKKEATFLVNRIFSIGAINKGFE
jgi:hypothetical protein